MKKALVCGSVAFDYIMIFEDLFKNHILLDKTHMLNVSFYAPSMRKEFGGCAGNITYNLSLLGVPVLPVATMGKDFDPYYRHFNKHGIDMRYLKQINDEFCAQAFIISDLDNNQITAFHPGAMTLAHQNDLSLLKPDVDIAIVSPDSKQAMQNHANCLSALDIAFIFDPGQGLPLFNKDELIHFLRQAKWAIFNDYELQLFLDKTQMSIEETAEQLNALIVTKGSAGAEIYHDRQLHTFDATSKRAIDATGCGDAFRAGLIYGLLNRLDWQTTGNLASLIAGIKVLHQGGQNHCFDLDEIQTLYQTHYGISLNG